MIKDLLKQLARIDMPVYKYESDSMKFMYAGYSSIKRLYYARLLLNNNSGHTFLGRYWYSKIPQLVDSSVTDLIISEISPNTFDYFQKCDGYILPIWATTRINIEKPACEIFSSCVSRMNYKNAMRCIRNYNLTYEILTDEESFNYFNDRFYHPYMNKRHGDEAFIEDLESIWKTRCDNPSIMAIKEDGVIVGMILLKRCDGVLYLMRLGLLDGNKEYLNHGVVGAMYYNGIIEGQKWGCKSVDLGGTRPFLSDGLTKYKIGWGGEFLEDFIPTKEYLWFGVNQNSQAAKEFMQSNSFMHLTKDMKLVKSGMPEGQRLKSEVGSQEATV